MNTSTMQQVVLEAVRLGWIERAEAIGLPKKGKRRGDECLSYVCGAATVLEALKDSLGGDTAPSLRGLAWVVSIQGAEGLERPFNDKA